MNNSTLHRGQTLNLPSTTFVTVHLLEDVPHHFISQRYAYELEYIVKLTNWILNYLKRRLSKL